MRYDVTHVSVTDHFHKVNLQSEDHIVRLNNTRQCIDFLESNKVWLKNSLDKYDISKLQSVMTYLNKGE
jgi:hypothetical protein